MITQPSTSEAYNLLHNGALAFARAERQGLRVDVDYCVKQKAHLSRQITRLEKQMNDSEFIREMKKRFKSKFNPYSDDQLAATLYDVMGLRPEKRTASDRGSTDDETLSGELWTAMETVLVLASRVRAQGGRVA